MDLDVVGLLTRPLQLATVRTGPQWVVRPGRIWFGLVGMGAFDRDALFDEQHISLVGEFG